MSLFRITPITRKRLMRFRQLKRAWWSFLLLATLYFLTLFAEFFCNTRPLLLHHRGQWYFPAFRFYPESAFLEGGTPHRADYIALDGAGVFNDSFVLWAPVRNDPYRIIGNQELSPTLRDVARLFPEPKVAGFTIDQELRITKASGIESLLPQGAVPPELAGKPLSDFWTIPETLGNALAPRWRGDAVESLSIDIFPGKDSPLPPVRLNFAASPTPRLKGRSTLRVRVLEMIADGGDTRPRIWRFKDGATLPVSDADGFSELPEEIITKVTEGRKAVRSENAENVWECTVTADCTYRLVVEKETPRFPYRPIAGHLLGIDNAGRDVFARIFYGLRIALNFGMLLVIFSMSGGTFVGILQGYRGGLTDLAGQRFIEIWSALPFLYVMILMGSIYGAGFMLLLVCYALFNWIGISYYMRAETLRLKKLPFVEAARCLGLSGWKIAIRHILPNALVPLITFFPFSLVGAIGSLAALDYLGFGLPAPTPSLGELLSQAQAERSAWWLTLYPSLALFAVMLLGVFIGEGIRNAFDPRRQQRLQ